MALQLWGNKLLVVSGDLAAHADCCCEDDNCNCCTGYVQGAKITLSGVTGVDALCDGDFCDNTNGEYDVPVSDSPACEGDTQFEWLDDCEQDGTPTWYSVNAYWNIECTSTEVWINWIIAGRFSGDVAGDMTRTSMPIDCLSVSGGSPITNAPHDPHWCNWDNATASIELY